MAMDSKRFKKELELFPEKNISDSTNDDMLESETSSDDDDHDEVHGNVLKRKHKVEDVGKRFKKDPNSDMEFKNIKKRKSISDAENGENEDRMSGEGESENEGGRTKDTNSGDKKKQKITWPSEDLFELINRMESNIPETDGLAYRSRVEKLNWNDIAFKSYNAEECKTTWLNVQKKIRRFRLLREILSDAKELVTAPATYKELKTKKHPDMPRRPLSSYLLFYLKKKDQIISENPGLDGTDITKRIGQIFNNLPPEKRAKYEKLAATNRAEYSEKLKTFFENHPELVPSNKIEKEKRVEIDKSDKEKPITSRKDRPKGERGRPRKPPRLDKGPGDRPPQKCQTPFGLFYASELNNMPPGMEKSIFKEKCKEQYKQMSDKKKIYWINLAEQDLNRYEEEVKAYKVKNPNFQVHKVRPILTKREILSKERASGKPVKPPNSAYALYSRVMLQSEAIKTIHPKDRMNFIAGKWKNCTEEEQNVYKDQVITLTERYKANYEEYLNSLPEEEKKLITQSKGKSQKVGGRNSKSRSKRGAIKSPAAIKFKEPEQPPISACKYFATLYKGEGDPALAWKSMSVEEKRKYEEELVKKKQAYIVEFEKFLKSLTKEELEAFSKSRQQQSPSDDESSECLSESDDDDEDDDNGGDTNQDKIKVDNNDEMSE